MSLAGDRQRLGCVWALVCCRHGVRVGPSAPSREQSLGRAGGLFVCIYMVMFTGKTSGAANCTNRVEVYPFIPMRVTRFGELCPGHTEMSVCVGGGGVHTLPGALHCVLVLIARGRQGSLSRGGRGSIV